MYQVGLKLVHYVATNHYVGCCHAHEQLTCTELDIMFKSLHT